MQQQPIIIAYDNLTRTHWFHPLPFQQFQALLTLFPKSFSPFPHGTCFLSVPNHCLASDESYHPLCAPIPRNVTLSRHTVHRGAANGKQGSHLHWCSFPRDLHLRLCWQCLKRLQVKATGPNFHAELIPVHSPLLWGSCLVSCPPLTYMLKFSRFASLTSCLVCVISVSDICFASTNAHCKAGSLMCWLQHIRMHSAQQWHEHTPLCTSTHRHHTSITACVCNRNKTNRHQSRHAFRYIPKAQNTFKTLLIHGILQFTKVITLRCALHRCLNRDIHR